MLKRTEPLRTGQKKTRKKPKSSPQKGKKPSKTTTHTHTHTHTNNWSRMAKEKDIKGRTKKKGAIQCAKENRKGEKAALQVIPLCHRQVVSL